MNFLNPYSRPDYKNFFQNDLLTDNFRIIEEEIKLEYKPQFINKVYLIGKDKSLELEVYEIQHNSEYDPRVGISKDFFRLMASYGSKRALAVFHSPKSANYRLSLATVDLSLEGSKIKKEYSNPRRFSFFLGPDAKVHTPNNFLVKKGRVKDFDDLQNRFSIEVVNKEFYTEIANWYFWALKKVNFPQDVEVEKNGREISVIRLITRLIFIWFMKVRELVPEELFNEDKLKEILTDLKLTNDNYYKAILQNLFFATLNTKQKERRFTSKKKGYKGFSRDFGNHNVYRYEELFMDSEEVIEKYFMPIPFLNGGLFECLDYKTKTRDERKYIDGFTSTKAQQPSVPNFLFFSDDKSIDLNKDYGTTSKKYSVRGLINTLSLYNFTIDESDPNDADVALDPELLGKVFENLLASYNPETAKTARKSTGSYYTPRPIVDYMVDESLKQYFKTHIVTENLDSKLNILFSGEDQSNPFDSSLTKKLVSLIDSLRVVDPAVGSGAFPMRILNRLVFLLHKLDPDNVLWKQSQIDGVKKSVKDPILQRKFIEDTERKFKEKNPDYGRKLYLIEKCIYGVDIQQIAVEIAKLRFFISLLVDEKVENGEIEPLPNLDFKLMQGNSLISSFAGIDFTTKPQNDDNLFDFDEKYKQLIDEFEELKSQYQNEPDVHKKRKLRDDIDAKLIEIFENKLKQSYPQLKTIEESAKGFPNEKQQKEYIEIEKRKLFKNIGIDLEQAEQDLIAYTEGRKQKDFFLWDVYFAEVFAEKNGFDIVIGNPPWGQKAVKFNQDEKKLFKIKYPYSSSGIWDISRFFIEASIEFLKSYGCFSFILPDIILLKNYDSTRLFILNNISIRQIIHWGMAFENVNMDSCTIFGIRSRDNITNVLKGIVYEGTECKVNDINQNLFLELKGYKFNLHLSLEKLNILEKLKQTSKFGNYFTPHEGIHSGNIRHKLFLDTKKNNNCKKLILGGKEVQRFLIEWHGKWVNYNTDIINKKEGEYAGLGKKKYFESDKLIVRRTGDYILANLDRDKFYISNNFFICMPENNVKVELEYFVGLLNSDLITWFFNTIQPRKGKLFAELKINHLKDFPTIIANTTDLVQIVKQIINLKKTEQHSSKISELIREMNEIVYNNFSLTSKEIKHITKEINNG